MPTVVRRALIATVALLIVAASPAVATAGADPVGGAFTGAVPIIPTAWQSSPDNATTGTYEAVGTSQWQGTWTGVTTYHARATGDLNQGGAGSGTMDETFIGRSTDGGTGTIVFRWTYVFEPDGRLTFDGHIVGATGDFTGATGKVTADGVANPAYTIGTFRGSWSR